MSDKKKKDELDKELQDSLIDIFKLYEKEDDEIRKAQVRLWKKYEEFWHGVQYLFWSARDETWRSPTDINWQEEFSDEEMEELGSFYDYVVNIFKGHGEAIIAALSAQLPSLRYQPDDADSSDDLLTAKTYDKIADLIQRHNKVKLLALKAFFYLYINGVVASYVYKDSDFKYGSYTIPEYASEEVESTKYTCPKCDAELDLPMEPPAKVDCPECGEEVKPKKENIKEEVPKLAGTKKLPKTRVIIDILGGLQFKVRATARSQEECKYFISYSDIDKELAIELYPDLEEDIISDGLDNYDRFARTEFTYPSDPEIEQKNLITIYKCWMRPICFNKEIDKKKREKLKELFPDGVRIEIVGKNKSFGRALEEDVDSRIRIGQAGLSTFIHSDAICTPIVPVQEMRNTIVNLGIETIEHGIPEKFADPRVLNFDEYAKFEATPGYYYKTLPAAPNKSIGDAFYESTPTRLSAEVPVFQKTLDEDAQFVLGSFPSVYGGPIKKDRSTLGEYKASEQIALRRLQIVWSLFVDWYKTTIDNAVRMYIETIVEDEHFVKEISPGNYVNVWIRQSEMNGKVGGCESDADASFPVSLAQKKALIMELMQLNNEYINTALYTPENSYEIQNILALNELRLPGEQQRLKQVLENKELYKSEPIEKGMSLEGESVFDSSVPIEPDIDDDAVHISTCRALLVSTEGIDMKKTNPKGYLNIFYHMKAHMANLAAKTMQMNETPSGIPPKTTQFGAEQ